MQRLFNMKDILSGKFFIGIILFILIALISVALYGLPETSSRVTESIWVVDEGYKVKPFLTKNADGVENEFFSFFVGSGYQREKDYSKKNYIWDASQKKISLHGARNEYLGFQVVIEAKEDDLERVTVSVTDLTGPGGSISAENIRLFREHYVNIPRLHKWSRGGTTGPGEYPDALIPFDIPEWGAPFNVLKGRNQAVWVDLYIPSYIPPGLYNGTISIKEDQIEKQRLNIELNVWNITLPPESHLPFWACAYPGYIRIGFGWGGAEGHKKLVQDKWHTFSNIETHLWKMCQRHRLTAMSRHWYGPGYQYDPKSKILKVNWINWDKKMRSYIDGSLFDNKAKPPILILPVSGGAQRRWPHRKSGGDPDGLFQAMLRAFSKHLKEIGWDPEKRTTFIYLCDEKGPETHPNIIRDIKLIKEVAPEYKVAVYTWSPKAFHRAFQGLKDYVDYWNASGEGFDVEKLRKWRAEKPGRLIGLYHSDGDPRLGRDSIDTDGIGIRTWPWVAWKYRIDSLYMYVINATHNYVVGEYKKHGTDPFKHPYTQFGWGQGIWVYPGRWIGVMKYIPSIRLKQVRRGMQDYEYMWLASQKVGKKKVDEVVNGIIGSALSQAKPVRRGKYVFGNWSHDPEEWFHARVKLAKMIMDEDE